MVVKRKIVFLLMLCIFNFIAFGMKKLRPNFMFSSKKVRAFCFSGADHYIPSDMNEITQKLNEGTFYAQPFIRIERLIFNRIQNKDVLYGIYKIEEVRLLQKLLDEVPTDRAWNLFLDQKIDAETLLFRQTYLQCVHSCYVDEYVKHVHNLYGQIIPKLYENKKLSDLFWENLALNKKRWVNDSQLATLNMAEKRYFETRNLLQMAALRRAGFDLCSLKPL